MERERNGSMYHVCEDFISASTGMALAGRQASIAGLGSERKWVLLASYYLELAAWGEIHCHGWQAAGKQAMTR